jgi:antirestriction protein ArdC
MSKYSEHVRAGESRTNLYDEITAKIVGQLEARRVPWVQSWGTAAAKVPLVYADRLIPDDEHKRAAETGENAQAIPFLKRFTVFNTDQCSGLSDEIATVAPPPMPGMIEPRVEAPDQGDHHRFLQRRQPGVLSAR